MFKDKVAGFKFINPVTSGVANSEITNRTGILNPSNEMAANGLKYIDPPKMPSDLMAAVNFYKEMFFLISGSFELEAAQTPGKEVIAYKAIAALIEHASNMLKGKIENYSRMVRERGRMYLSHVMNFYTEDRWIPVEKNGVEEQIAINGSKLRVPAKLMVVSGSMMLRSKVVEREEALGLFEKGAIDDQELLKRMGWSNTDIKELITRKTAGPLGELFEKMAGIGVPEDILGVFNELSQLEQKEFEGMVNKGEVPSFSQMVEGIETQEDPMQNIEANKATTEIEVKQADIQKTQKEIDLLEEKINTEKVNQEATLKGVEFDERKIVIEESQTIDTIKRNKKQSDREDVKLINDIRSPKKPVKQVKDSEFKGKTKESPTSGYREKGLKSNNKDKK